MKSKIFLSAIAGASSNEEKAQKHFEYALLLKEDPRRVKDCSKQLRAALQLEPSDVRGARHHLVALLIDEGDAGLAEEVMDQYPEDTGHLFMYTRALIAYISFAVLNEPGASAVTAQTLLTGAFEANSYIGSFLAFQDVMTEIIDPAYVDGIPAEATGSAGTIDQAFAYCVDGLSLWLDAEGAQEWLHDQWWSWKWTTLEAQEEKGEGDEDEGDEEEGESQEEDETEEKDLPSTPQSTNISEKGTSAEPDDQPQSNSGDQKEKETSDEKEAEEEPDLQVEMQLGLLESEMDPKLLKGKGRTKSVRRYIQAMRKVHTLLASQLAD